MTMYFITGNKNKFEEAKIILPEIEQIEIDLPEVQDIDPKEVVKAKLLEATKHKEGVGFIVEDTSLYLDCLNGLPGPLIKWFEKAIGNEGIVEISEKFGNNNAEARTIIGYAKNQDEIYFFEGAIRGKIVFPKIECSFGWNPIFQPDGHDKTFAEMTKEEKNSISMRGIALRKLKDFLEE